MGADVFTQTHPGRFELPVSAFGGQCPIHWTTDAYLISKIEVGFGELAPHGCHQFVGIGDSPSRMGLLSLEPSFSTGQIVPKEYCRNGQL